MRIRDIVLHWGFWQGEDKDISATVEIVSLWLICHGPGHVRAVVSTENSNDYSLHCRSSVDLEHLPAGTGGSVLLISRTAGQDVLVGKN